MMYNYKKTQAVILFSLYIFFVRHVEEECIILIMKKAGKYSGESTHSIYYLSDDERSKLETKSINGDAEAAFRLYKYYSFSNYDADEQMRYLAIAASHNNIMAEYAYGIFLSCKNGPYSKYYDLNKAIYWMKLAAAHGHTEAKTELLRLEELK